MGPIDYLSAVPQQDFMKDIAGGLQLGIGIRDAQFQQQQQQAAAQRAQQYQSDVSDFYQSPTAQGALALSLKYPDRAKPIADAFGNYTADQQRVQLQDATTLANLLHSDRADLASQQVVRRIQAAKNSGLPTADLESLQSSIDNDPKGAYAHSLDIIAALPGGDVFLKNLGSIGDEGRKNAESTVKVQGEQVDNATKNAALVSQTLGSLQGKNAKPSQAITAIKSLAARGALLPADAQAMIDSVPTDPKALDAWFGQQRAAGMKPEDQMKYTTPDANAKLQAETSVKTTGMNNRTSLAVQDRIDARAKAESEGSDDSANFTPEAIDNAAARYNVDGTLPPMGMGKAAAAGRTKILNRAAELKLGVSPEQQRLDQLYNKGDAAARNASVRDFSSAGKSGQAIQAANTSLNHLETVEQLALAQKNGNMRLFNQIANKLSAELGGTAPTNLNAALTMVAPEVSKAVIGSSGTGEERAAFEKRFAGNGSPEQAIQGIGTVKELLGGRLTESQRTYERTTKKTDFESMLSPAAKRVLDRAHQAAHAGPAPGTVDGGYRFKGGDPSKQSNWERL